MPQHECKLFLLNGITLISLLVPPMIMAGGCPDNAGNAENWLERVNEIRADDRYCGSIHFKAASSVKWSELLLKQAERQAKFMAQMLQLNHKDTQGRGLGDHLDIAGYHWQIQGEVIAAGYDDVESALEGWINSPAHCAIIMAPEMIEFGAACMPSRKDDIFQNYWSMALAAPKP